MSGHLSTAAYLDLAGQGRRSCLALHRAGFAWPPRHRGAGALLPHHFTFACTRLTCGRAIGRVFLWHFPAGFPGWALPTALPLVSGLSSRGFLSPRGRSARPSMVAPTPAPQPGAARCPARCNRIEYPDRRCRRLSSPEREAASAGRSPSSSPAAASSCYATDVDAGAAAETADGDRQSARRSIGARRARRGRLPGVAAAAATRAAARSTSGSTTPAS